MACWTSKAGTNSSGARPCAYHRAANPISTTAKPCPGVGRDRGGGRRKPRMAVSGPRNRISSFDTSDAVTSSKSQVKAADEATEIANPAPSPTGEGRASVAAAEGASARSWSVLSIERATATWPAKGTAGNQRWPSEPGSRAEPARAAINITTGVSVFCASLALFDAAVTVRQSAAATAARPT